MNATAITGPDARNDFQSQHRSLFTGSPSLEEHWPDKNIRGAKYEAARKDPRLCERLIVAERLKDSKGLIPTGVWGIYVSVDVADCIYTDEKTDTDFDSLDTAFWMVGGYPDLAVDTAIDLDYSNFEKISIVEPFDLSEEDNTEEIGRAYRELFEIQYDFSKEDE